jgi:HEAT repeat protein
MAGLDVRERESILLDLTSPDDEVRRLAVERAVTLDAEDAVARLVECLGDTSWRVRKAAVERLCAWSDPRTAARSLIAALADGENPGRRNAAVEALVRIGRPAVPHLIAALSTRDVDVRKFLVDVLAGIGCESAVSALVGHLEDDDVNVRAASADALGVIGGEAAVRALLATATGESQDALVRFSALHALAGLESPVPSRVLVGALSDPVLRPAALSVLGRSEGDPDAVDVLLEALEDRSRASREAAMRSLVRALGALSRPEAEAFAARIREVAARSPELLHSAIERLPEADLPTRLVLVQFLGVLRRPEAALPLLAAGTDEALRQVAMASLRLLGDVAEQAIDDAWSELSTNARRDACALFAHTRGARSAARLVGAMEESDPEIRIEAARSIGVRGLDDGLPPLVRRLTLACDEDDLEGEEEHRVVSDALIALAGPERCADPARADRAIDLLTGTLAGSEEPVRVAIARVLGCIGRHHHHELLGMLLKDASALVRRAAVDALTRLGADTPIEPLHLAIADESADVRVAVAAALGARAGEDVMRDLCRLAEDPDARVRAAAVRELGLHFGSGPGEMPESAAAVLDAACGDEAPVALALIEATRDAGCGGSSSSRTSSCATCCCGRWPGSRGLGGHGGGRPGEVAMTDAEFRMLAELLRSHCGLHFGAETRFLLERRLGGRIASWARTSPPITTSCAATPPARASSPGRSTRSPPTRPTSSASGSSCARWSRDPARSSRLAAAAARPARCRSGRAGCSSGEEPYSIVMLAARRDRAGPRLRVYASDISRRCCTRPARAVPRGVLPRDRARCARSTSSRRTATGISDEIKKCTSNFIHLNLMDEKRIALLGVLDVILCRNVIIYFDLETKRRVIRTFDDKLRPGGYLLLGHSESLINLSTSLRAAAPEDTTWCIASRCRRPTPGTRPPSARCWRWTGGAVKASRRSACW